VDKDGKVELPGGPFTLFVHQDKNRIGVRDQGGWIVQVPLSDVVELIRGKVL